ncbi:type 4b pilus protein PilO2 [Polaromonas aquatica]|uniref:Type 4b pilus protein PilO2 n=1 Tax=Polaromonas aquatica TaxID=332657 RepID=A0ABW1TWW7_9BURK
MRIIEIQSGKKTLEFVAGLIWHPLNTNATRSARAKEVLSFAESGGADLKVMRGDDSPHVGLAKKADGAKAGQLSAAAVIADSLAKNSARNILVAMSIPDNQDVYVYVAVRGGVILADGDAVGTADEIRVRMGGAISFGGWDRIICPAEWGNLDSEERTFDSFFSQESLNNLKSWRLEEIKLAWRKAVLPLLLLIAVAGATSYGWNLYQKKKIAAAEALRLQQEAENERGQRVASVVPTKPWLISPGATAFAQACSMAYSKAELAGGNWTLDGVICEGGLLTVTWKKTSEQAWISHLKTTHPNAVIANDGQSASVAIQAVASQIHAPVTSLPSANGLALRYYDLASRYGLALRIEQASAPAAPAVLPGQVANAAPVTPSTWSSFGVNITANFDPAEVAAVLDYPGLRFTKIAYIHKAGAIQYQLTGVQYVRL